MSEPATPERTAFRKTLREDAAKRMRRMTGIVPDLVNPHEPSGECGGTHCYMHHVDESDAGAYRRCGECGHVYRTTEDLREAWADAARGGYGLTPDTDVIAPPAEQIWGCPLCAHDF